MAMVNARAVRRSNALLHYGPNFRYNECAAASSATAAKVASVTTTATTAALLLPPVRWLVGWMNPLGSGPSEDMRENGMLDFRVVAKGDGEGGPAECPTVVSRFRISSADPGYKGTSMMVAESGMCLVKGLKEAFGDQGGPDAGVLTPATAFGGALVEKLNRTDHFQITADEASKL